jgi:mannan endo-1,4-beta-mannosidase
MHASARNDYTQWVNSTARLIKHFDTNHLVTIGVEGSISTLQDLSLFEEIHRGQNIDFCTLHLWPKTWNWYKNHEEAINDTTLAKTEKYIVEHVQAAQRLHKPLIIEELGMQRDGNSLSFLSPTSQRDAYFKFVLYCVEKYKISGFHFWGFAGVPESVGGYLADPPQEERGLYSVRQ